MVWERFGKIYYAKGLNYSIAPYRGEFGVSLRGEPMGVHPTLAAAKKWAAADYERRETAFADAVDVSKR